MTAPRWLTCEPTDVPPGDAWLGPTERRVHDGLAFVPHRDDWRLGRWTAKAAVAAALDVPPGKVEILAAPDGAPEARIGGEPAGLSISLSHRGGRGLAAIVEPPAIVGCDLELIEPRSAAFLADWLAPGEQALVAAAPAAERDRLENLIWTAKEAAAKVRREGRRIDVRRAVVEVDDDATAGADGWRPLTVRWDSRPPTKGWWRAEPGWVMTVAAAAAAEPPLRAG
jgi:4'-phosphopantetheinyl transferase